MRTPSLVALALLLATAGCEEEVPDKLSAEDCTNLEDDDGDDLADCADPDCASLCGEVCNNGADDDRDGLIDCLDDQCDGLCPENCGDGRDNDGDGQIDCDDRDCFGSCPEVCGDGFDNDGDGKVDCLDEECVDPTCAEVCTDGRDNDADGLSDCADPDCSDPACPEDCIDGRDNDADGRVDCDDADCDGDCPEVCDDGRDNDADGRIDCDDDECEPVCDADGDGFFSEAYGGDDCDDTRGDVNPARPEICNGDEVLDDDCDGLFDEDDADIDPFTLIEWGPDADGDGYGVDRDLVLACQPPVGYGRSGGEEDCDDTRADVNPGMPEICNPDEPLDDDCDGLVDDADPDVTEDSYLEWYADRDGDGYGADDDFVYACSRPDGAAATNDDCDDDDPTVFAPALWYGDADGDGYGGGEPVDPTPTCDPPEDGLLPDWPGVDCDESEPRINPGALEVCENGIDEDCSGADEPCVRESCQAWLDFDPTLPSGVYRLVPDGPGPEYEAYCLMDHDGGGWTVMAFLRDRSHWDWDQFDDVGVLGDTAGGFNSGATLARANQRYSEKLIVYNSLTELGVDIGTQWMKNSRPDPLPYEDITEPYGWSYADSYGYSSPDAGNVCSHGCGSYRGFGMFNYYSDDVGWCGTQGGDYGCEDGNNICWMPRSLGCNVGSDRCANLDELGGGVIYAVR